MQVKQRFNVANSNFTGNELPEIRLSYSHPIKAKDRPRCGNSEQAFSFLYAWWNKSTIELFEEFVVLFLDRQSHALGIYKASQGGIDGTVADVRLVFAAALKAKASAIIIAHNHPSGALMPSQADIKLTAAFVAAGRLLNIHVLEHLILVPDRDYFSFADHKLIEQP